MKKRFNLKYNPILILIVISCIALFPSLVSASDVLVWQGQYYTGTTFNTGTYNFNFSVYDALTGGDICYSNTTTLTTGSFGEWKTEQTGVNSACNNVSKDYYLNININDVDQTPRRRLVVWDSLRKNVDETTISSFEADIIKVRTGLKDLNKAIWQSKLNYARELANTSLVSQRNVALKLITTTTTTTTTGESTESKIIKVQQAGEQAKTMINSEFEIAQAKIFEAKKLALLNGEKPEDVAAIEAEANLNLIALNLTAQEQKIIVEQALNDSINEVIANDDGIRFCLSNGTNCQNNPIFNNITANSGFFSFLGSLTNRITKLWVQDIDVSGNVNVSGNITANYFIGNGSLLTGISSSSTDLTNYALKNQSETFAGNITTTQTGFFGWLGSLTSRITKLWVQDIDVSGNLTGVTKEVFFPVVPSDANLGDFRTESVASGGIWRFNFQVPSDFSSLTSLDIILIPVGTNAAAPLDLYSDCGAIGEAYNLHSESLSTTWNLGTANNLYAMNISGVFTSLGAGDFCGLQVDEGAFGFATNYLGIRLKYKT